MLFNEMGLIEQACDCPGTNYYNLLKRFSSFRYYLSVSAFKSL